MEGVQLWTLGREDGVQWANCTSARSSQLLEHLQLPEYLWHQYLLSSVPWIYLLMSEFSPIHPWPSFRITRGSGCNYGNTTNNKDPNITLSSFCIYHSLIALCFCCDEELKDYSLNCYCVYTIIHSTGKTPWGQKPYSNRLCGKNRTIEGHSLWS